VRLERREPSAGGLADLALAEGARARPGRSCARALPALAGGRAAARQAADTLRPARVGLARAGRRPRALHLPRRVLQPGDDGRGGPGGAAAGETPQRPDRHGQARVHQAVRQVRRLGGRVSGGTNRRQDGATSDHLGSPRRDRVRGTVRGVRARPADAAGRRAGNAAGGGRRRVRHLLARTPRPREADHPDTRRRLAPQRGRSSPRPRSPPCGFDARGPRASASPPPRTSPRSPPSGELPPLARSSWQTGSVPATVIVGAQWGDEGKGKIVDLLAQRSDVVCRYNGGPNAGHTIVAEGETFTFRQMPSGIVRGTHCVLGAGCVVDPAVFVEEVDDAVRRGVPPDRIHLSGNAHLIMPWHVMLDAASERRLGKLQIGTTRRGIGPAYADKAARIGIRVQDVLDPKILRQKIEVALAEKNVWLERIYGLEPLDLDGIVERYEGYAERLRPFVSDTSLFVDRALRDGLHVLFEGGQATLLDLDHGTYPFVTSSNPIAGEAATGIGIGPTRIDAVVGVAKAYVTRVGEGPFPTEIAGPDQARVRELGSEFGTVTGRERRC